MEISMLKSNLFKSVNIVLKAIPGKTNHAYPGMYFN